MLRKIRESKIAKVVAVYVSISFLFEIISPNVAWALTGGPSQPEVQSFEPIGTSEMVDLFSGDFTYNIPLLDVGGYPVNISYNSGIGMDQEASWVGLGWNINPGVITRNMRGMPDDFNGSAAEPDEVTKEFNMKPNRTFGVSGGFGAEVFGSDKLSLSYTLGVRYNNYSGISAEQSVVPSFSSGKSGKGPWTFSLGISSGADGLNLSPNVSYSKEVKEREDTDRKVESSVGASIGGTFNSRAGLKNLSVGISASTTESFKDAKRSRKSDRPAQRTRGLNGGSSISFGTQSYVPSISMPMNNAAITTSFKMGGTLFGADGTFNVSGYYSEQKLQRTSETVKAYGYLNLDRGQDDVTALLDFNREKDGAFTLNTPNLPLTNMTYDIYSVAGQGIGGMYRPYRGDVGYVYDRYVYNGSTSGNLGFELASGNTFHAGGDISLTDVITTTGPWNNKKNQAADNLLFKSSSDVSEKLYEPVYFKQAGEKSVDPTMEAGELFDDYAGYEAARLKLINPGGLNIYAGETLEYNTEKTDPDTKALPSSSDNYRKDKRQRRNQAISYLTVAEAKYAGLQTDIYDDQVTTDMDIYTGAPDHHIGEITTLRDDGSRYVFGLPAYNTSQREVTFNAAGRSSACSTGVVTYVPGDGDNSTGNERGIDNFFSATNMDPYAHSYLLTAIVSPDYVDYDNTIGPSKGDLGNYTKFNYKKMTGDYKWRTPFLTNSANYSEGLKTMDNDDRGSYIYGNKEIWYLDNIETKNFIAVFITSPREDGYGVEDEDGGIATGNPMKKLDRIELYSKPDFDANYDEIPAQNDATPIKVVHFEYDYSLCDGIGNNTNSNGKLTLKKVLFSYGNSEKAMLSPYQFTYTDYDHDGVVDQEDINGNPNYNLKGYDRWGNYAPNHLTTCSSETLFELPGFEYPYTTQVADSANLYAKAWHLTDIELPSGGTIEIDYEADDYAYVQNKRAMQMFKVVALGGDYVGGDPEAAVATGANSKFLMETASAPTTEKNNLYMYVKLLDPLATASYTEAEANDYLAERYFKGIDRLYFKFMVSMTNLSDYEYVSGYAEIDSYGVTDAVSGNFEHAWIKLKHVDVGDREGSADVHPIAKAAWQFGRLHTPTLVWDQPNIEEDSGIEQVLKALANASILANVAKIFKGPNNDLRRKGYGKKVVVGDDSGSGKYSKSWVRLNNPRLSKFGGGSRVSKVVINDEWDTMGGSEYTKYGQEYTYTKKQTIKKGTGTEEIEISSGVASYEPMIGNDENPFRQPVFFKEENLLAPDGEHFMEGPFGESFFPSPSVGYSQVEVKNLQRYVNDNPQNDRKVIRHATGKVVHEFYTAKDFPTLTRQTSMQAGPPKKLKQLAALSSIFKISITDNVTASQGYIVELNDMHGKQKAQWVYAEDKEKPISGVEYIYKTDENNASRLSNTVTTIDKDADIEDKEVGVDYDISADFREQSTDVTTVGLNMNLAGFLVGFFPALVPVPFPAFASERTRFRSAVMTKVVKRYGILETTIAHDLGSKVETENLAYDALTGEVLVTKTRNDFNDPIYSTTYPAHWGYDRMGQAAQNLGVTFSKAIESDGDVVITDADDYFVPGDEVLLQKTGTNDIAWVCEASATGIKLIEEDGDEYNGGGNTFSIKVVRSGRRNQQITSIGTVTTRNNPLDDVNDDLVFTDVLNTGAVEFSEEWKMACGTEEVTVTPPELCECDTDEEIRAALLLFLNTLAGENSCGSVGNRNLLTDGENDQIYIPEGKFQSETYFLGFTSTLNNDLPEVDYGCDLVWDSEVDVDGKTLNGTISQRCSIGHGIVTKTPLCTVQLVANIAGTWDDVCGLNNITYFPPEDCNSSTTKEFCFTLGTKIVTDQKYGTVGILNLLPEEACLKGSSSCWNIGVNCASQGSYVSEQQCGIVPGDAQNPVYVNPYVQGIRGNWRAKKSHLYLEDRKQTDVSAENNSDIRIDGDFESFSAFWNKPTQAGDDWSKDATGWTSTSEVTEYSPFGFELENVDALGRYSSAIYGYNNSLPIAVASNARYRQISHDNFEDYDFDSEICNKHFKMVGHEDKRVTTEFHTGCYSMKVEPEELVEVKGDITSGPCNDIAEDCKYELDECDCLPVFAPDADATDDLTYVISVWVKEDVGTAVVTDYDNVGVSVSIDGDPITVNEVAKSPIIDGWQQITQEFDIPSGSNDKIEIVLSNTGFNTSYFDDLRIHPFDANMKTFVYDPISLRLVAELDENNYATFYEYDEEGALNRVKKETEKGVKTIQDSKNNSFKALLD